MDLLDLRTVFATYVLGLALCFVVMTIVWRQNRDRYPELKFWVGSFALFFVSNTLIVMRDVAPDWLTVILANALMLLGTILLLEGLARHFRTPSHWRINVAYLIAFTIVHALFTYLWPSLSARALNWALAHAVMLGQGVWLLFRRIGPADRSAAHSLGWSLTSLLVLTLVYAFRDVFTSRGNDMFEYGIFTAGVFLTYEILFVFLAFALVLLVARRLHDALERDLDEREQEGMQLARQKRFLSAAFESVPDAVAIGRLPERRVVEVNRTFTEKFGYARGEAVGHLVSELGVWSDLDDREAFVECMTRDGRCRDYEADLVTRAGHRFPAEVSGEIMDIDGEKWMLVVFHDITERKLIEGQLRELATRDALTGLLNHRGFFEAAAGVTRREHDGRLLLAYLDLDRLKEINDRYGHLLGDQALIAFAGVLQTAFRTADVVARVGGDEFVVMAVCRGEDAEQAIRRRLLDALEQYNRSSSLPFPLEVSIGVVDCMDLSQGLDIQGVVNEADIRMYEEKRSKVASSSR